jgi:hypothetical protein
MGRRRVVAFVGIISSSAVATGSVAQAVQYGSTPTEGSGLTQGEVSWGNNRWHSYSFFNTGGQAWIDAFNAATRDAYHNPTDLEVSRIGNSQNTDVRVSVATYNTGLNGWVSCPSDAVRSGADPNENCWNQFLKIDLANTSSAFWDAARRKSLACHEFGHTVGLRHDNDSSSCMTQSAVNPNRPTLTDQDEWDVLNFVY